MTGVALFCLKPRAALFCLKPQAAPQSLTLGLRMLHYRQHAFERLLRHRLEDLWRLGCKHAKAIHAALAQVSALGATRLEQHRQHLKVAVMFVTVLWRWR